MPVEIFPPVLEHSIDQDLGLEEHVCIIRFHFVRERRLFPLVTRDLERKSDKRKNRPQVASSQPPFSHLTSFFFLFIPPCTQEKKNQPPSCSAMESPSASFAQRKPASSPPLSQLPVLNSYASNSKPKSAFNRIR